MKILIVDDEMVSRRKMEIILRELGDCTAVESGGAAVHAYVEAIEDGSGFDLVTLDVSLPDMDGTEVLRRIRQHEHSSGITEEKRARILMVTSHGDQETVMTSIAAGCDDYVKKPFTLERITRKLEKLGMSL